jgi:hypothetical protein
MAGINVPHCSNHAPVASNHIGFRKCGIWVIETAAEGHAAPTVRVAAEKLHFVLSASFCGLSQLEFARGESELTGDFLVSQPGALDHIGDPDRAAGVVHGRLDVLRSTDLLAVDAQYDISRLDANQGGRRV